METRDVLVDVSGGSETYCTLMIRVWDAWAAQNFWEQVDWVEFNTGSGGIGTLFDEHFTDSVHMERTGTVGDYGYISTGVFTVPIDRFQEEGADFEETKFGATW